MRDKLTTFYITKYALTQGIFTLLGHVFDVSENMIVCPAKANGGHMDQHFHGNDWHHTYKEAKAHAERMRIKKIDSHKRSIAKLEKLTFPDELV